MKKIFFLFVIAIQFSFNAEHAADEIVFKTQFDPEKKYTQSIEQTSMSAIRYSGSKEFLQNIKDKGIKNPTVTNAHSITDAIVRTGKITNGNRFPFSMEYVKTTSSDGKAPIPDGTVIYGSVTTSTMPKFDSIISPTLDAKIKKLLLKTLESTFEQLSFPERKVKVGEQFSIKSPLTIPIAGVNIEMDITTNYKLLSVKDDIADFDIKQVYTMKLSSSQYTIKGSGTGSGKLLYDVTKHYNTKYQTDIDMKMHMKLDDFDLDLKMHSEYIQLIQISDNK